MSALLNMVTGKDNKTHDPIRLAIVVMTLLFPPIVVWCMIMVTAAFWLNRPFDLVATGEGIGAIFITFGTFLMQGGGSLYFKRSTEPDGTVTTISSIKTGDAAKGPISSVTKISETNINEAGQ